jgi:hypothetical protein
MNLSRLSLVRHRDSWDNGNTRREPKAGLSSLAYSPVGVFRDRIEAATSG